MSRPRSSTLVLDASGRTGQLVLAEAIRRGLTVVALVRNQHSLEAHPNLIIVEGSPLELEDVERAFDAAKSPVTALISILGQIRSSGSPWAQPTSPPLLMANAINNAIIIARQRAITLKAYDHVLVWRRRVYEE